MASKFTINLHSVEDGDLKVISMITNIMEEFFYDFIQFDQMIKLEKDEDEDFVIQISNRESGKKEGEITLVNPRNSWKTRPYMSWDFEINETFYFEEDFEEDYDENLFSKGFQELLKRFKNNRESL